MGILGERCVLVFLRLISWFDVSFRVIFYGVWRNLIEGKNEVSREVEARERVRYWMIGSFDISII